MKQEIINRIKQLGGNVTNVKGTSLSEDLCAITFNTALYKKPEDTPWLSAEDTEPIEGLYGAQNETYIEGWEKKTSNLLIYKRLCKV